MTFGRQCHTDDWWPDEEVELALSQLHCIVKMMSWYSSETLFHQEFFSLSLWSSIKFFVFCSMLSNGHAERTVQCTAKRFSPAVDYVHVCFVKGWTQPELKPTPFKIRNILVLDMELSRKRGLRGHGLTWLLKFIQSIDPDQWRQVTHSNFGLRATLVRVSKMLLGFVKETVSANTLCDLNMNIRNKSAHIAAASTVDWQTAVVLL